MLDQNQLRQHFENDEELFSESKELILEQLPIIYEEAKAAHQSKDHDQLKHTTHALRGMVCNFFADELTDHLRDIEKASQGGEIVDDLAMKRLDELVIEFQRDLSAVTTLSAAV